MFFTRGVVMRRIGWQGFSLPLLAPLQFRFQMSKHLGKLVEMITVE